MTRIRPRHPATRPRALTLIETITALTLAIGLTAGILGFYQAMTQARNQLRQTTQNTTQIRAVMEQITEQLQTATSSKFLDMSIEGDNNQISILTTACPPADLWIRYLQQDLQTYQPNGTADLKIINYQLQTETDDQDQTVILGLQQTSNRSVAESVHLPDQSNESQTIAITRTDEHEQQHNDNQPLLIAPNIRFVYFSYYDGNAWQNQWSGRQLPQAVRISLGNEPIPEDAQLDEYLQTADLYTRTICIPAAQPAKNQQANVRGLNRGMP